VLDTPDQFLAHVQCAVNAIILCGYQVTEDHDPLVLLAEYYMENFTQVATPGSFLVDVFPSLKHLPAWFPGTGFQRYAAIWRHRVQQLAHEPMPTVKKNMAAGTHAPCFTSKLLEDVENKEEEEVLRWSAPDLHAGGADTSVAALQTFYLAMTLHPIIQEKGQAEINAVVRKDRLPIYEDRENQPYMNALVKEVLRYGPTCLFSSLSTPSLLTAGFQRVETCSPHRHTAPTS